ncbi:hypothetical protein LTR15_006505 [Elasticomyces elasticus]|nr:hypothetical protein LTR15_006505 [Elasticomyces elasticus]
MAAQRKRLSNYSVDHRMQYALLQKYDSMMCLCDITWFNSPRDPRYYDLDKTIVCRLSLAWLWWTGFLEIALNKKTIQGLQLDRAMTITKLFRTVLEEWDVHIGTQFWHPDHWGSSKLTLQVSTAGFPHTNLKSILDAAPELGFARDAHPSFRLFYNTPGLTATRSDEVPIHDISATLIDRPSDSSDNPNGRLREQGGTDLRTLVNNDEGFCRALIDDIKYRQPPARLADEMIQALRNRDLAWKVQYFNPWNPGQARSPGL